MMTVTTDDYRPLTPHCYGRHDLLSLDWCDQLLDSECADLDRREALARQSHQMNLSFALAAQRAIVDRLRVSVRSHFWALSREPRPA